MRRSPRQARRTHLAIILGLLALTSGCNKTETAPTPEIITENFTGVLGVLGTDSKTFTVTFAQTSEASVTVTGLRLVSDNSELVTTIGVGFGTPAFDLSCQRDTTVSANAAELNKELITPAVFRQGPYCVQIFDSGTLTEPVNYTLVVKHY